MITQPTNDSCHSSNPVAPSLFSPKLLLQCEPTLIQCRQRVEQIVGSEWTSAELALAAALPNKLSK